MMFWQLSDSTTENPTAPLGGKPSVSMIAGRAFLDVRDDVLHVLGLRDRA